MRTCVGFYGDEQISPDSQEQRDELTSATVGWGRLVPAKRGDERGNKGKTGEQATLDGGGSPGGEAVRDSPSELSDGFLQLIGVVVALRVVRWSETGNELLCPRTSCSRF